MNEYGKRVAKEMNDYMDKSDIIEDEIRDIQKATHGIEVRGALAAGVKKSFTKSEKAEDKSKETEQRQDAVEQQFNTLLSEWSDDKPIDNAETIAARTNTKENKSYENLGKRLDEEYGKVTAQLAETSYKMNKGVAAYKKRTPMISIIDDDGHADFLEKWVPVLSDKNFKIDVAVVTDFVENHPSYMDWEDLKYIKDNYNVDIINHSHKHPDFDKISDEEIRDEFETSKRILFENGYYNGDIFVYPRGLSDYNVRQIARDYFRGAFYNIGGNNYPPFVQFNLRRTVLYGETDFGDMNHIKQMIDNAVTNNGWVVLISHANQNGFDADKIKEVIDYANNYVDNGQLEWVHAAEGLDRMGNIFDIGDNETQTAYDPNAPFPYKVIDCEGREHSNFEQSTGFLPANTVDYNTPLTGFPRERFSYTYITSRNPTINEFPEKVPGVLKTFQGSADAFSYQTYKLSNSNRVYIRRWINNSWGPFEKLNEDIKRIDTGIDFNTPPSDFESNKITVTPVTSSNADGFPEGAGLLITYRYGPFNYVYQTYKPSLTNSLYIRSSNGSGTAWNSFTEK